MHELPLLTRALPGVRGRIRATPEDFRVEEIPAYLPSGEGDHTYALFEKRALTTRDALERIARALRVNPRDIGYAGLKDRHAVTVQWASLPKVDPAAVRALDLPGVRVLDVSRHRNKLRTGHLHGNRFVLRVTEIDDVGLAFSNTTAIASVLRKHGCPNYYGDQRFGREGDNASRGLAWLRGEGPAPREHFQRKLMASAAQSELFNGYLGARVADGLLDRYVPGDLAVRHPVGGPWPIEASEAEALYDSHAASATGPMFGTKMRKASGEAAEREEAVLREANLTPDQFARFGNLGEGTRRAVRVLVDDLTVEPEEGALRLTFTLPAGAYATVVLAEICRGSSGVATEENRWHPTDESEEPAESP